MNDQTAQDQQQITNSYVDDYTPPTTSSTSGDVNSTQSNTSVGNDSDEPLSDDDFVGSDALETSDQDIEAQNIFLMLGVDNGDEALKEKFLDQLQEIIWDDFLTKDVELLLTQDELVEFKSYKQKVDSSQGELQETAKDEMVEYLEKLIPDLEDIMLEKALDLKADLFVERINGMKTSFAEKPQQLERVTQAEQFMYEDKWKSAVETLNSIVE